MREYETTFIVQPEISEEGREALLEKLDGALGRAGATRLAVEDHGKRKLAYDIRKFQKGHYLTLEFLDEGKGVVELERSLRLEESVLRYLTVLVEPEVADIEARKAQAEEQERIRREKAAERAAREAEERAAREDEERERIAQAEAAQAEAAQAEAAQAEPAPAEIAENGEAAEASPGASEAGESAGNETPEKVEGEEVRS